MNKNELPVITVAALGTAFLIAISITGAFGLVSFKAKPAEPVAADAPPPANATEGMAAYNIGIPGKSTPKVFFANIGDGATVTSPVFVEFGMVGMNVMAAGEVIEGTGHHHLLINKPLSEIVVGEALPADETHIHFGDGSTSTTLELAPGSYTLQLLAANGEHVPNDPMVASNAITITVVEEAPVSGTLFETTYGPLMASN